jgi:uncharacterized protein YukE
MMEISAVNDIEQAVNNVAKQLEDVGNELSQAIARHTQEFEGQTKDAFIQVQGEYQKAHETMTTDLGVARSDLEQIREHIQMAEKTGSSMWGV